MRVIVETGGFAQAAQQLHRSQSSVSYAVSRLQERLGIGLLEVIGRKAQLTEIGKTLLAESAPLIDDLLRLEERARSLASGNEARVRLLVDSIFPKQRLFPALAAFEEAYPHVRIDLRELVKQTALDVVSEQFDLAISAWSPQMPGGQHLTDIELLAVAHRDHPLLKRRALTKATLSRFRRVYIQRDNAGDEAPPQDGPFWRVNTVETAIEAVSSGLCYGWLPRHLIAAALDAGTLVALPLAAHASRFLPLMLSHGEPDRVGPAARALAGLLLGAERPAA